MYDIEELGVLESLLNQYNALTWRNMFETQYCEEVLIVCNNMIDKTRFVIFYDREWHIVPCNDRRLCMDINRTNYSLHHGATFDIGRDPEALEEFIYVRNEGEMYGARYNTNAVVLVDSPNGPFLIPRETFNRYPRRVMGKRGDGYMVVKNNISDFIIDGSGELRIDQDGITFKNAYGEKWNRIATTYDMLNIYGTETLKRLLEYIASPSDSKMDVIIKNKMNEILTKAGEN